MIPNPLPLLRSLLLLGTVSALAFSRSLGAEDSTAVFSEIQYHPAGTASEWIELHSLEGVDLEVGGWRLAGAVSFTIPAGTVIPGHGYLVIAANPADASLAGTGALGPWSGSLNNAGEEIRLENKNGRIMERVDYMDSGRWPVGADGSGATLAKLNVETAASEPGQWTASQRTGGTPGAENFAGPGTTPATVSLIAIESSWKYRDDAAAPPADWNSRTFDDSAWAQGGGLLYAGTPDLSGAGEGLIGYWPLEETSGAVAPNAAPGGTPGALNGGVAWVTNDPVRGNVLSFPGAAGDFVSAGSIPQQTTANDFTWSFWANSSEAANNDVVLGNRYAASGADFNPREFIKFTTSQFEFHHDGGGDGIDYADIPTGVWQHHAVVKSGSLLTYYRNGVAGGTHTINAGTNNPQPFFFGGSGAQEPWTGRIDDVAIWTKALPASSIAGLFSGSVTPLTAPTGSTAGTLATEIAQGPGAHYFRRAFTVNDPKNRVTLKLQHLIDDGAVFYLNGTEILRANMPAGPVAHDTPASTNITTSGLSAEIVIPSDDLAVGMNVLAVEVHQATDNDLVFGATLTASIQPAPARVPGSGLVFSEISAASDPEFRIELANPGAAPLDLDGYRIVSSAGTSVTLGAQSIPAGGFVVLTAADLGFTPLSGHRLFLFQPGGAEFEDAQQVTNKLRGRDPAHANRWLFPSGPTFGAANAFTVQDSIVINEIMYHPHVTSVPAEEWIEICNRSAAPVDLSGWKFSEGIGFTFPPGTIIPAGDYLVVADNADALRTKWPAVAAKILGNFSGGISGRGELIELVDAAGNPADEVDFADGGRWPEAADGDGSSMELRDPRADNNTGEAWAASDESHRGSWQTYTAEAPATVVNGDPTRWNEFIFGLLDRGTYLIDDISVIENPAGTNRPLIQNGTFDSDAAGWRFLGTQQNATVIADPSGTGQVLRVISTGPTEHMHNHAETTLKFGTALVAINSNLTYRVSFRARWVSGNQFLNARLYFNRLGQTVSLPVAPGGGTPGAANTAAAANIGPTYSQLAHSPAVPAAGQACTVSAGADDPDGIAAMALFYSVNGGAFTSTPMALQDGVYSAAVPGQGASAKVQFYVQATDGAGAVSFFPQGGPNSRAIVPWQDNQARLTINGVQPNNIRIVTTAADAAILHTNTNVMSNDRAGCTVIYNEREIFYDCGVHLRGSERGRNQPLRVSFNVQFPANQRFLGAHNTIGIDRSGAGNQFSQKEILIKHGITHAGDIPGSEDDLCRVISPLPAHIGPAILVKQRFDGTYLDNQYANGAEGRQFKYELIYYPTSTTNGNVESLKVPEPDSVVGVGVNGLGPNKENYRWHWLNQNNEEDDDYSGLMAFLTAFPTTNNPVALIDVDEWLRSWAIEILYGIGDNYATGAQHNFITYQRPSDGRWLFFPHDMDFTFSAGATSSLTPNNDLSRIIGNPANRRTYYGHVLELCTTTFNSTYLRPWAEHYTKFVNENLASFMTYVDQRRAFALNAVNAAVPPVAFDITTADGSSPGPQVTVEGTAWLDVREMRLAGSAIPLDIVWLNQTTWRALVTIAPGPNAITVEAYGATGNLIASDTVNIMGTGADVPASAANLVISEIMYHPAPPSAAETAAGFTDGEVFEFLELQNISAADTITLAGVKFTAGIAFDFPATSLAPGARTLIVASAAAFTQRYGAAGGAAILGAYQPGKRLANGSDHLVLVTQAGQAIRDFTYDDSPPWPSSADGSGFSLVLIAPESNPDHAVPSNWRSSAALGGNPGASDATPLTGDPLGDDNANGILNLAEYALTGGGAPFEFPRSGNANGFLTITFRRNLAADGAVVTVQRSTMPGGPWTSGTDVENIAELNNGDGTATVTWRSTHPLGETEREFLRLQIAPR